MIFALAFKPKRIPLFYRLQPEFLQNRVGVFLKTFACSVKLRQLKNVLQVLMPEFVRER